MGNGFRLVFTLLVAIVAVSAIYSAEVTSADGISDTASLEISVLDGGIIDIDGNFTLTNNISITQDTVLRGSGGTYTITRDLSLGSCMFTVETGISFTLENIILDGGGPTATNALSIILVKAGGELNLRSGSVLTNNHISSEFSGAAVHLFASFLLDPEARPTTLNIDGGSITNNNSGANGGGIASNGDAVINITSGTISGNTASGYGGGIYAVRCDLTVSGGEFSDNHAERGGGIASVGGDVDISGGIFDNNAADISGGALLYLSDPPSGSFKVSGNTEIKNNSAVNGGGIAYGSKNGGEMVIPAEITGNVEIHNNTADLGGGLFFRTGGTDGGLSELKITDNVSIHDNTAVSGGGIYSISERTSAAVDTLHVLDISGKTSISFNAANTGGGITSDKGLLKIYETVSVDNNHAQQQGGGLYLLRSEILVSGGSEIKNNTADTTGGGVYVYGSVLNISEESKVTGNEAHTSAGGIYIGAAVDETGSLILSGTGEISYNKSEGTAGGVLIDVRGSATFTGNIFMTENLSGGNGSGIYLKNGGTITVSGSPRIGRAIDDNTIFLDAGTFINITGSKLGSSARIYIGSISVPAGDGKLLAKRIGSTASEDEAKRLIYTADLEYCAVPSSSEYILMYVERYEITTDIPSDTYAFPMAIKDYGQQTDLKVRIFNVGNHTITHLRVTVVGLDAGSFIIGDLSETTIVPGGISILSIRPANGLAPGKYTTNISVSGSNGTNISFNVSFMVSAFEHVVITDDVAQDPYIYSGKTEGYLKADPLDVKIRNTADRNVTGLYAYIGGKDAESFILGPLSKSSISAGTDTCYFTVTPKVGLERGTYVASVSVSGDDGAYTTFSVSFTVSEDPGPGLGIWLYVIIASAMIIALAAVYILIRMRSVGVIKMIAGDNVTIKGGDHARRNKPYKFTVDGEDKIISVSYRIGAKGEWKIPGLNKKGQYEIPSREITDHITIRARD
ncbi:MAG: hypothetical protein LBM39_02905 [Candidatus Methanoplasma sp.]|nr:hypothetical protein [Candidatus Methanoplasma sp.]